MAYSISEATYCSFRHLSTVNLNLHVSLGSIAATSTCFWLDEPAVWGPEPGARSLCAEQLHGRDGVVEEVAKAKHGTNQNSWRSSAVLNTHTRYRYYYIPSNSFSLFSSSQATERQNLYCDLRKRKLFLEENNEVCWKLCKMEWLARSPRNRRSLAITRSTHVHSSALRAQAEKFPVLAHAWRNAQRTIHFFYFGLVKIHVQQICIFMTQQNWSEFLLVVYSLLQYG